jgi:hypothetical protein
MTMEGMIIKFISLVIIFVGILYMLFSFLPLFCEKVQKIELKEESVKKIHENE